MLVDKMAKVNFICPNSKWMDRRAFLEASSGEMRGMCVVREPVCLAQGDGRKKKKQNVRS